MLSCLIIVLTLPIIILLTFLSIYIDLSNYWVVDCLIHWVRLLITSLLLLLIMLSFCSIFHLWFVWFSTCLSFFLLECATALCQAMREHSKQSLSQTWLEIAATAAILACWISFHAQKLHPLKTKYRHRAQYYPRIRGWALLAWPLINYMHWWQWWWKQPLSPTWPEIAATAAILACWISFHDRG